MGDTGAAGVDEAFALEPVAAEVAPSSRRRLRMAVVLVPLAVLAAGVGVVLTADGEPDAAELLERATAALEDADSFHVDVANQLRSSSGDPGGVGIDTTTRGRSQIDVVGDDLHGRYESADPYMGSTYVDEVLTVGGHTYARYDDGYTTDGLSGWVEVPPMAEDFLAGDDMAWITEQLDWMAEDALDGELESFRLMLLLSGGGDPMVQDPAAVSRLVLDAEDPTFVESLADGGHRIRATLPPPEDLADIEPALPSVTLTLDVDDAGRPVRATFFAEEGSSSLDVEATWSSWNAVSPLVAPSEDEIDHTPWIDEDSLAALDPALLVAPTAVPGLELVSVSVWTDDPACPSLELSYSTVPDALLEGGIDVEDFDVEDFDVEDFDVEDFDFGDWGYLNVSVVPASCVDSAESSFPSFGDTIEVVMGDAVVRLDGMLDDPVLEQVQASLAPTTIEALAAAAETANLGWFAME